MDKITEALAKLLPEDQVKEVAEAVSSMIDEAKAELEAEYNDNLNEAYAELHKELKEAEDTAYEGYREAYAVINDLRGRLETQRAEFETALDEGYEEAYQMLQDQKGKNESFETDLYEEYDKKLREMKEYIVDKVDQFLQYKGQQIYENARKEIINDPRMVEHKVTLDRVIDTVSNYISDEDYALTASTKVRDLEKKLEESIGQKKILEARNIRLSTENNKLNEAVRHAQTVMVEHKEEEKKARASKAKNVQGRGKVITEGIIPEHEGNAPAKRTAEEDMTLVEGVNPEVLRQQRILSGLEINE